MTEKPEKGKAEKVFVWVYFDELLLVLWLYGGTRRLVWSVFWRLYDAP
jgi:hypothetical protein